MYESYIYMYGKAVLLQKSQGAQRLPNIRSGVPSTYIKLYTFFQSIRFPASTASEQPWLCYIVNGQFIISHVIQIAPNLPYFGTKFVDSIKI